MSAFTSISTISSHKNKFVLLLALGVFLCLFGGWFDPATTPRLTAWQMGIGQAPHVPYAPFNLISFGVLGAFFVVVYILATFRDNSQWMLLAATGMLFVSLDCYLQVGISRPLWLNVAIDGAQDFFGMMAFANQNEVTTGYSQFPNNGILGAQLTLWDRLTAGYICLSYGWLWFTTGGIICFLVAFYGVRRKTLSLRPLGVLVAFFALIACLQISSPVEAQFAVWRADKQAVHGEVAKAEMSYRQAIGLDEWYRVRPTVYMKIGLLQKSNGNRETPEARLAIGEDMIARSFYPEGISWLEKARDTDDSDLVGVVNTEISKFAQSEANTFYQQGSAGAARQELNRAYEARPDLASTMYMLGRVNFDLSKVDDARNFFSDLEARNVLPVMRATCLSAIGDCYYVRGEIVTARTYYLKSTALYNTQNCRSLKSMVDNYYR